MDGMNIKPTDTFGAFPFFRSGGGEDDVSLRVGRLESEVRHINTTLIDIKQDIRELRTDIRKSEEKMSVKFESFQKWLIGILLSSLFIPVMVAAVTSIIIKTS